jgi:hypothetical protein
VEGAFRAPAARPLAISSVLMNGHLFVGAPADTAATYRVQG